MTNQEADNLIEKMKGVFPTAEMVQRGFDETAKKKDIDAFRQETEERFDKIDARFVHVNARLDTIERDVKDIIHREEFEDLMARVKYVEKKLGIESGK